MDRRRFLDLYVSETAEHQRLLHRSLLTLERESDSGATGQRGAIDEAFRSAHTLKGLSAAMGHTPVADLAHKLEDRLDDLRRTGARPSAADVDQLLAAADALDSALAEAVSAPLPDIDDTAAPSAARTQFARPLERATIPPGTAAILLVCLRDDAPIKAARALLILRALDSAAVLGSDPASFADDFAGDFHVFLSPAADVAAATAAIRGAGDVASVERVEVTSPAAPDAAVERPSARHVRVESTRLDRVAERIGELSVLCGPLLAAHELPQPLADLVARLGSVLTELQHDTFSLRMVPVRESFERLPRVVRDAARTAGRHVDLVVTGDDVELDRPILEEIVDPLVHLLRNAVDHGIEEPAERVRAGKPERGRIEVRAERARSSVRITVQDDGRGIQTERVLAKARAAGLLPADAPETLSAEELFRLLSHAGLSTADRVNELSGRGVGMDVVVSRIRALGGAIELHTVPGQGTSFRIRLPITLALAQALRVRVGGEEYAIPLTHLAEAVELNGNITTEATREVLHLRSETIPLVRMRRLLAVVAEGEEETAVIADMGGRRAALAFDELLGREQILIKTVEPVAGLLPYFSGATLLADGRPALVLDPLSVL